CSRARLKISKGQVVFFEKITQKISTFKPLPIFILSVLSSLPKARLSKNKIFIVFRFSSVTDKTTQNKKDTREASRIFYSAIAPFNGRSEVHTTELQSRSDVVCRLLLRKNNQK